MLHVARITLSAGHLRLRENDKTLLGCWRRLTFAKGYCRMGSNHIATALGCRGETAHRGHRRGKPPRPADRAGETLRSPDPVPRHSGKSCKHVERPWGLRFLENDRPDPLYGTWLRIPKGQPQQLFGRNLSGGRQRTHSHRGLCVLFGRLGRGILRGHVRPRVETR